MGAQTQPTNDSPDPRMVRARLARHGIKVTPSTLAGRRAILEREPLRIPDLSVSEIVVQMRDETDTDD